MLNKKISSIVSFTILSIGLFASASYLAKTLYRIKSLSNTITVKGLAKQDVKADLAIWEIHYREIDNDLEAINVKLEEDKEKTIQFLQSHSLSTEEISSIQLRVEDRMANLYSQNATKSDNMPRYIVTSGLRIRTSNVYALQNAMQDISQLLKNKVPVAFDSAPSYLYTTLDKIRPEMLSKSTSSARMVANQFAQDTHNRLCGIQSAQQGIFEVVARDGSGSSEWGSNTATIDKKVRLVTTIVFRLC